METNQRLKSIEIIPYAFIMLPVAFTGIPIYIYLPEYYHSQFNVSLASLSISLFILRLLDAIFDPLLGYLIDKLNKYRMLMLLIIPLIFIFGFYILCVPIFSNRLLNLVVGVFLATIGFSFFNIFVNTQGALWKHSDYDKSKIIAIRESFNIIGVLLASVLPFLFLNYLSILRSYQIYSFVFLGLFFTAFILFIRWYKSHQLHRQSSPLVRYTLKAYFRVFDKMGIYLFSAYAFSVLGSAVAGVMFVFYSKYVLNSTQMTGLYLFLYFLGAIIGIYFVKKLALKFGIIQVWLVSIVFAIIVFSGAFFLSEGDVIYFSVISFLSGFCFAAEIILPNLLLAKWIDEPRRVHLGNGYYALLSFIGKFSFAIATVITLPWLELDFNAVTILDKVTLIKVLYCLMPILFKLIGVCILIAWLKWRLTGLSTVNLKQKMEQH
ncbi:MAG: sugar:cation symporter [Gammaproteobacteria bacterium]|nr:MAG: sugar:cation symporter [Gammaproteobacteria bacterium]UTW42424.1 MFS transporter [bacterium SCSIO 12844]